MGELGVTRIPQPEIKEVMHEVAVQVVQLSDGSEAIIVKNENKLPLSYVNDLFALAIHVNDQMKGITPG